MALETEVIQPALRVAEALHRYAKAQHWDPESYRVFMTVNTNWGNIHVTFVSDAFKEDDINQFDDIIDFLEDDLRDEPELFRSIGLILQPVEGYGFLAGGPILGPDDIQIPDTLLNPGVKDWRGPFWLESR
jgi:hypothetical protein